MCGISGYIGRPKLARRDLHSAFAASNRARGPDFTGSAGYIDCWGLTHNRLEIFKRGAAQPLESERFSIVFNGEIYNYLGLGKALNLRAESIYSDSQIVSAYIHRFGPEQFLEDADGMFAIAIYDKLQESLTLLRDRNGEKPLYYFYGEQAVYFSSTIRSFHDLGEPLGLDHDGIFQARAIGYPLGGKTHLERCRQLLPSHCLRFWFSSQGLRSEYLHVPDATLDSNGASLYDSADSIELALCESLDDCLRSDSSAAMLVSSGIDSSLLCALAEKHLQYTGHHYTVTFAEKGYGEQDSIRRRIAPCLHNPIKYVEFDLSVARSDLTNIHNIVSHPFVDTSILPVLQLARAIRHDGYNVAVGGDGGDEFFAGYARNNLAKNVYTNLSFLRKFHGLGHGLLIFIGVVLQWLKMDGSIPWRAAKSIDAILKTDDFPSFYDYLRSLTSSYSSPSMLSWSESITKQLASDNVRSYPWINDIICYLVDDIFKKSDSGFMSSSVELRSPYVGAKIKDLGKRFTLNGGVNKSCLRDLHARHFGSIKYKKYGFSPPLINIFDAEIISYFKDVINSNPIDDYSLKVAQKSIISDNCRRALLLEYQLSQI